MKRVLVIGRRNVGEKNDAQLLANVISQQSSELIVEGAYYEDVVLVSTNDGSEAFVYINNNKQAVSSYEKLILINWSHSRLYTDLAHSIAYIANKLGIEVWNNELVTARSSTKVSQIVRLSYEDVIIPNTVYSLTLELLEEYIGLVGEPFIAKNPLASRGRSNFLFNNWQECIQGVDTSVSYVVQSFIPNDKSDTRLLIVGGDVGLVILRRSESKTHLNNISQGATAELIDLNNVSVKLINQARMVSKHFLKELSGIDFMKNKQNGEYVFLEINTTPQIVNGIFVNEKAAVIARTLER